MRTEAPQLQQEHHGSKLKRVIIGGSALLLPLASATACESIASSGVPDSPSTSTSTISCVDTKTPKNYPDWLCTSEDGTIRIILNQKPGQLATDQVKAIATNLPSDVAENNTNPQNVAGGRGDSLQFDFNYPNEKAKIKASIGPDSQ